MAVQRARRRGRKKNNVPCGGHIAECKACSSSRWQILQKAKSQVIVRQVYFGNVSWMPQQIPISQMLDVPHGRSLQAPLCVQTWSWFIRIPRVPKASQFAGQNMVLNCMGCFWKAHHQQKKGAFFRCQTFQTI